MKRPHYLLLLFLAGGLQLSAQVGKGALLLGGTASFQNTHYINPGSGNEPRITSIEISPAIGFMLTERFVLGGNLTHAYSKTSFNASGQYVFSAIPFARYFLNGGTTARLFLQANAGLQINSGDPLGIAGAGLGADLFLNDQIAIELVLDYTYIWDGASSYNTSNIGFGAGIMTFLGKK